MSLRDDVDGGNRTKGLMCEKKEKHGEETKSVVGCVYLVVWYTVVLTHFKLVFSVFVIWEVICLDEVCSLVGSVGRPLRGVCVCVWPCVV